MDSFPQLQRCFERQWAGLEERERRWMDRQLSPGFISGYPVEIPRAHTQMIWYVGLELESGFGFVRVRPSDCLMSIKTD